MEEPKTDNTQDMNQKPGDMPEQQPHMQPGGRKKWLWIVLAVVAAAAIAGGVTYALVRKNNDTKKDSTTSQSSSSSSSSSSDTSTSEDTSTATTTEAPNCGLTVNVTEGPYYVSGTGALADNNLNYTNLTGTPIKISGHVYAGADGTTPVANAKIELWEADDSGNYHPNANGAASKYSASQLALRGYITSKSDGSYEFSAIYPGYYEGRARHIHVKVAADGYTSVTTQLIFKPKSGDGVTYSTDSIAQSLPSCNLMDLDESSSPAAGLYDFRLSSN